MTAQPTRSRTWLNPVTTVGLIIGWFIFKVHLAFWVPSRAASEMFYLLIATLYTLPAQWILFAATCVLIVLAHRRVINHAPRLLLGASLAAQLLMMLVIMPMGLFRVYFAPVDSVSLDNHTYQLVFERSKIFFFHDAVGYVVMECDESGVLCHYYGTPYYRSPSCFDDGAASLEVDATTQTLTLRIGDEIYPVEEEFGVQHKLYSPCMNIFKRA